MHSSVMQMFGPETKEKKYNYFNHAVILKYYF